MLTILDRVTRLCDGLDRREWLRIGSLGAGGLTLPALLAAREAKSAAKPKACIMLFLLGAPPQQETWDPKPNSPLEMRGDLKPIASATPGLHVGETMVRTAKLTEQIAVLRAVSTRDNAHSSSGYYMTTGVPHAPIGVENAKPGAPNNWPSHGAIIRKVWPHETVLPAGITLPEQSANDGNLTWPGQDAGFLGRKFDPWLLECDPTQPFQLPGMTLPPDVSTVRLDDRRSLLHQVDQQFARIDRHGTLALHHTRTQQAFDLINTPAAKRAFKLDDEGPKVRDRYGRSRFGQSCLLARRLVEAGVPLVRVNWTRVPGAPNNGHWDTHSKNTEGVKALMPILDQAYSALLEDLRERGLLDDTLVVWTGEFGRTPKLNGGGGRDHWGAVFSVALAGGGVKGGRVYGASDSVAAYPKEGRVTPSDLQATIFHCLGLDPATEMHDAQNRPFPITRGEVIRAIL